MTAAETVKAAMCEVGVGEASTCRNLTMLPLVNSLEREIDYVVLDEGLARGWVEVTESGEAGRVPELKVINRGNMAVLLLDGEELLGAKQNRVLNLTILVAAQQSATIPVSCVESGRWHRTSRSFAASRHAHFAEGRAAKMRQVTASMLQTGVHRSDQRAVWDSIGEKSARLGAMSDTAAMSAMYDKVGDSLEQFVEMFQPLEHQVGAVFLLNGRFAGLELFDAASTWRKLSPKLVRSYALDAVDHEKFGGTAGSAEAATLIEAILSSDPSVFPAVGEGEDVRLTGAAANGAALVARGRTIHLSAFPVH